MSFTRSNPSPRYQQLQLMYRQMHEHGEQFTGRPAEHTFNGMSLMPQLARIKSLIDRTGASTILDYGCGKGRQYEHGPIRADDGSSYESVLDYWGVDYVHCYDPAYAPYSELPQGRFDGVVSTDVLEHCPELDIPWITEEIFSYANRFVFANVACYPARKRLPDGENAHCTIQPADWWENVLREVAVRHRHVLWQVWVQSLEQTVAGPCLTERCLQG